MDARRTKFTNTLRDYLCVNLFPETLAAVSRRNGDQPTASTLIVFAMDVVRKVCVGRRGQITLLIEDGYGLRRTIVTDQH